LDVAGGEFDISLYSASSNGTDSGAVHALNHFFVMFISYSHVDCTFTSETFSDVSLYTCTAGYNRGKVWQRRATEVDTRRL
jgi:hypothetical protein